MAKTRATVTREHRVLAVEASAGPRCAGWRKMTTGELAWIDGLTAPASELREPYRSMQAELETIAQAIADAEARARAAERAAIVAHISQHSRCRQAVVLDIVRGVHEVKCAEVSSQSRRGD